MFRVCVIEMLVCCTVSFILVTGRFKFVWHFLSRGTRHSGNMKSSNTLSVSGCHRVRRLRWVPSPGRSHSSQSEAAQSFSHSDSLARLQIEAEVLRSFKQQNNGGAEVKLSNRCPFLQGYACCASRGHAPITAAIQKLVPRTNVAAVEESAFGVARSIRLQLLHHIQAPSTDAHIYTLEVSRETHLVKVNPDGAHVGGSDRRQREEAVLPLAEERHALVKAEKLFHQTSHTRVHRH